MFNLYTYEKRQKIKKLKEKEKANKIVKHKLYLKNRDKLADNFYKKINNFIIEMAKKPIIINNSYYQPKKDNNNTSFYLKKFQTDRERIEKLLNSEKKFKKGKYIDKDKKLNRCKSNLSINNIKKYNNYLNNLNQDSIIENNNNNTLNINKINYNIIDSTINQPSMKFKPRNDLERIFDSIYNNQGFYVSNNKLIKIYRNYGKDLFISAEKENEEKNIKNNKGTVIPYTDEIRKNNSKYFSLYNKNKSNDNSKIFNDKINYSSTVKNITERYHSKTYFNSIEQAVLCNKHLNKKTFNKFKNNNMPEKTSKNKMNHSSSATNLLPSIKNNSSSYLREFPLTSREPFLNNQNIDIDKSYIRNDLINNNVNNNFLVSYFKDNDKRETIEKVLKLNNPTVFNQDTTIPDTNLQQSLLLLKKMAMNKPEHKLSFSSDNIISQNLEDNNKGNNKGVFLDNDSSGIGRKIKKNKKWNVDEEKYVILNDCIYNKSSKKDMEKLGKIILQKCHFINTKYDKNKNNKLKKGNGKLMMTNGLPIKEFINKYSLPKFISNNN